MPAARAGVKNVVDFFVGVDGFPPLTTRSEAGRSRWEMKCKTVE
jgi:hypothetical protein